MKILITGASGFIGKHLCQKLHYLGHEISVIKRIDSKTESIKSFIQKEWILEEINYDLNKVFFSQSYDAVIHLATQFQADHQYADIKNLIEANYTFGLNLVDAMTKNNCFKLINFSSSWQEYSQADKSPVNLYASIKKAFAVTLDFYQSVHNLNVLHLRIYDTYGPADQRRKIIPILVKAFKDKSPIDLSPGDQLLDLVHVEDICAGVMVALKGNYPSGSEYALATLEPKSLKSIAHKFEILCDSKNLLNFGGRPYRNREVMQPTYPVPQLPGWKPQIPLEEGLKSILGSYAN
jgi:nucleoside-diphosphate-sugar epimerase